MANYKIFDHQKINFLRTIERDDMSGLAVFPLFFWLFQVRAHGVMSYVRKWLKRRQTIMV
jgi:hypothetical protein